MKTKKMNKKLLSLVMAIIMLLSVAPILSVTTSAASGGSCGKNLTWEISDDGVLTISGTGKMFNYDYEYYIPDENVMVSPFSNRNDIKTIKIGKGVTSIGSYAFPGCSSVEELSIPKGVTSIGRDAFSYCKKLKSVKIPEGVTKIANGAFSDCVSLEKINLPKSLKTIEMAFDGCTSLKTITIPANVSKIEEGVLSGCKSLSKITVAKDNQKYFAKGNCLIEAKTKKLIAGCSNSVIPDDGSVKTIAYCAFEDADGLKSLVIPKGVTTIDVGAFSGCKALKKIVLPSSIKRIEQDAFYDCSSLKSIVIPEGVIELGIYTFASCKALKKIWLPSSLITIDAYAFESCKSLSDVYYGGTKSDWKEIEIDKYENDSLLKAAKHFSCCKTDGHKYETVKTKATPTKDGKIVKTCLICGNVEKKVIYKASKISLSKTTFTYNGKTQKPSVIVKDSKGKTISKDNYSLKWSNAKSADTGTYSVTVKFKGNYSGSKVLKYKIK